MLLQTIDDNIKKYKMDLIAKRLSSVLIAKLSVTRKLLDEDMDKKFALVSRRYAFVQKNRSLLNDLYDQLNEICSVGKILYRQTNKAKLKDYSFTQMMNQVRRNTKEMEECTAIAV
jgi:phosphopentomutase